MNRIAVLYSTKEKPKNLHLLSRDDLEFIFVNCKTDKYLDQLCGAVFIGAIIVEPVDMKAITYVTSRIRK